MGNAIGLLLLVGVLAFSITLARTLWTVKRLRERVDHTWTQLTALLSERHLVVSHLVDAIPAPHLSSTENRTLARVNHRADSVLRTLGSFSESTANVSAVAESQLELHDATKDLLALIDNDREFPQLETVTGCREGLQHLDDKIRYARVTYNDAAITHTTYVNTALASLVCRFVGQDHVYRLVDWTPYSSSTGATNGHLKPWRASDTRSGFDSSDGSDSGYGVGRGDTPDPDRGPEASPG